MARTIGNVAAAEHHRSGWKAIISYWPPPRVRCETLSRRLDCIPAGITVYLSTYCCISNSGFDMLLRSYIGRISTAFCLAALLFLRNNRYCELRWLVQFMHSRTEASKLNREDCCNKIEPYL